MDTEMLRLPVEFVPIDELELATEIDGLENPFLDAFLSSTGGRYSERFGLTEMWPPDVYMNALKARRRLNPYYAWAVPDDRALELVGATGSVVEIGAGGGYWAALLRARGVEVFAYDRAPAGNHWVERPQWSPVEKGGPARAADHPDATLLLCWPPMSMMATVALHRYVRAGGVRIAYVGEHYGCTADDSFHELLEGFRQLDEHGIPQWWGLHDYLGVWELP